MKFRLVLQPVMAAFFAIRSGLEDARAGKPPYKVLVFALLLDVVYQIIVLRFVYPARRSSSRLFW